MTQAPALDPPIELQTSDQPSAAVIWLHGLGADGHDFAGVAPELRLPPALGVRFVFPHAPMRAVSINNGFVMRAWYDIAATPQGFAQNEAHLAEAGQLLHALIAREIERGVPAQRIIVAGFSQGGAVALHGGLRFPQRLAGAVILSAPVPYLDDLLREAQADNAALPLFIGHGRYDPMVPFGWGEQAAARLRSHGWPVEWHAYDIEHSVNLEEIHEIGRFITSVLE